MVVFQRPPPRDDGDLLEKLCDEGGTEYLYLRFEEKPTNLPILRRIITLASDGAGMKVAKLHIEELSFLTGYERPEFSGGSCCDLQHLESASLSIKFQKNVWNQIRELTAALFDARQLDSLSLSIFEYPTDAFLNQPEYRNLDKFFVTNLPSMLGLSSRTERIRAEEEEEGRRAGQLIAACLMGPNLLQIRDEPPPLLENLVKMRMDEETMCIAGVAASSTEMVAMPQLDMSLDSFRPARLSYLTRKEWDETVNAVLDRPLPPSLRNVTLCMIMPKEPCIRFIESMQNVESLNLSYCSIDDKCFARLAPAIARFMTQLKRLSLCRNDLSDVADLAVVVGPVLQHLDLSFNQRIGGYAVTSLFRHMSTLNYVNFANTRFRTPGLSFDDLDRALPNTHYVIPNLFSPDEVERIQSCLSDGSILELDGPYYCHGNYYGGAITMPDAAITMPDAAITMPDAAITMVTEETTSDAEFMSEL